jgi:hypothetical protein
MKDKHYEQATHADLMRLTRLLLNMSLGDLGKMHRDKAAELGFRSPSAVWIRAVLMTRMAMMQDRRKDAKARPK